MRKRHPLDVYREGRPFRRGTDGSEGDQGGEPSDGERWPEVDREELDRSGWSVGPRLPSPRVLASVGGVLVLGLALVGPWLYTGKFWPNSVWNLSNNLDEDPASSWPDRTAERPGGGEEAPPGGSFVVLAATGVLSEEGSEERDTQLKNWDHEEERLQQLLDTQFPGRGLFVATKLIQGSHAIGLMISRWYAEDDPELREVLTWVRALDDGQFSDAVVREIADR